MPNKPFKWNFCCCLDIWCSWRIGPHRFSHGWTESECWCKWTGFHFLWLNCVSCGIYYYEKCTAYEKFPLIVHSWRAQWCHTSQCCQILESASAKLLESRKVRTCALNKTVYFITQNITSMLNQRELKHEILLLLFSFLTYSVTELLQLCDVVRDDMLPELGVRLEDHEGKMSVFEVIEIKNRLRFWSSSSGLPPLRSRLWTGLVITGINWLRLCHEIIIRSIHHIFMTAAQ